MIIVKTHTGTVITKNGPKVKKLHQTERMWVTTGAAVLSMSNDIVLFTY
ncbi:TPA: hypothetical protein OMU02_002108 [Klebsiella aerogenes]|nr:hypothetical protein [Klebsiella aerogenes]